MLWICNHGRKSHICTGVLGFWLLITARTVQFCWNCAAIFGSTVLSRTAAAAAVLDARTGQFWSVFADQNCPLLLLFWQQNGCGSGCQNWAVLVCFADQNCPILLLFWQQNGVEFWPGLPSFCYNITGRLGE